MNPRIGIAVLTGVWLLTALRSPAAEGLKVAWTNHFLTIAGQDLPGGIVKTHYLEAFCRSGSTHQDWREKTKIPHTSDLLSATPDGKRLRLKTTVEPSVEILHDIVAGEDDVEFNLEIRNTGGAFVDAQWFQPCIRLDRFTGGNQSNYIAQSFIFTRAGLVTLDKLPRTEEAIYKGGQVYVPRGINTNDVNPRPISPVVPANALIGCFSADGKYLLATAWDQTQELFQGVLVCLHSDPRIGGLKPGETKKLRGKVYFLKNDPDTLLKRYQRDFPNEAPGKP